MNRIKIVKVAKKKTTQMHIATKNKKILSEIKVNNKIQRKKGL